MESRVFEYHLDHKAYNVYLVIICISGESGAKQWMPRKPHWYIQVQKAGGHKDSGVMVLLCSEIPTSYLFMTNVWKYNPHLHLWPHFDFEPEQRHGSAKRPIHLWILKYRLVHFNFPVLSNFLSIFSQYALAILLNSWGYISGIFIPFPPVLLR